MRSVVITLPEFFAGEASKITQLLLYGVERVHIRKPGADEALVDALVSEVPRELWTRLSIHDFPEVARRHGCGFHLNSRVAAVPDDISGVVSKSCHSIEELGDIDDFDYVFLSPIFDSISKPGYRRGFSQEALAEAAFRGMINSKVFALGGVTPDKFGMLEHLGFGGAALLGSVWMPVDADAFKLQYITQGDSIDAVVEGARAALDGGCSWVQLRMKDAGKDEILAAAERIRPLCSAAGAVFILDDHVELVEAAGANGVHLGKNDMPVDEAFRLLGPGYIIGATANTFDDIERACHLGASYIGLGPLRFTTTKKNLSPVLGYEGYSDIIARCRDCGIDLPVVAIGGITNDDIAPLGTCGVNGVAVSGAIAKADDPVLATRKFIETIKTKIL